MHPITLLAFQEELEKLAFFEKSAFDVMHAAAKEGIELAKKLKAKNLVPKAGNTLKDYMGHMDLSAHPKFSAGVKATAQGGMKKVAFTLAQLPVAGGALGAATGAAYGLARPGKDAQGKQKSRLKSAVRKGAIGAGIGAVGLPVGVIGGMAGSEALSKLAVSDKWLADKAYSGAKKRSMQNQANQFAGKKVPEKETLVKSRSSNKQVKSVEDLQTFVKHQDRRARVRQVSLKGALDGINEETAFRFAKDVTPKAPKKGLSKGKVLGGLAAAGLLAYGGKKAYDHFKGKKKDGKNKKASAAAELGGLGILAAPSIAHLRGKDWSEKNKARAEVAGLGVLAAPTAISAGKAGIGKLKSLLAKMPKHASKEEKSEKIDIRLGGFRRPYAVNGALAGAFPGLIATQVSPKAGLAAAAGGALLGGFAGHRMGKKKDISTSKKLRGVGVNPAMYGIKEAAPSASAMMNMHRLADSAKAMKNVAKPAAQAVKLPSQASQAVRASHLSNHMAQGGHAWNPAAQAKRAIPL